MAAVKQSPPDVVRDSCGMAFHYEEARRCWSCDRLVCADPRLIGSLLVGYYDAEGLRYAGAVGTGFDRQTHRMLYDRLSKLVRPESPFVSRVAKREAIWAAPKLVAQVEYRRWIDGDLIRQAAFQGLRFDKPAGEVVRERKE